MTEDIHTADCAMFGTSREAVEWLSSGGSAPRYSSAQDPAPKKPKKLSKKAALALVSEAQEAVVALATRKKLFTNLYLFDSLEEGHLVRAWMDLLTHMIPSTTSHHVILILSNTPPPLTTHLSTTPPHPTLEGTSTEIHPSDQCS